jgi:hypothetical protein
MRKRREPPVRIFVDDPDTQQLATSTDVEEVARAVHDASEANDQGRAR